jgi:hypothetical protein
LSFCSLAFISEMRPPSTIISWRRLLCSDDFREMFVWSSRESHHLRHLEFECWGFDDIVGNHQIFICEATWMHANELLEWGEHSAACERLHKRSRHKCDAREQVRLDTCRNETVTRWRRFQHTRVSCVCTKLHKASSKCRVPRYFFFSAPVQDVLPRSNSVIGSSGYLQALQITNPSSQLNNHRITHETFQGTDNH